MTHIHRNHLTPKEQANGARWRLECQERVARNHLNDSIRLMAAQATVEVAKATGLTVRLRRDGKLVFGPVEALDDKPNALADEMRRRRADITCLLMLKGAAQ